MSSSICAACRARIAATGARNSPALSHLSLALPKVTIRAPRINHTRDLHTTPSVLYKSQVQVRVGNNTRESRAARLKKKARVVTGLPKPGQRREEKRRIVLSNTSAIPISGLQNLSEDNLANEEIVGKVFGFKEPVIDQLRDVEAFKTTQKWSFFSRPATLIRKETRDIGAMIREITHGNEPKIYRRIYSGERATGKSVVLAQAQAMAFMNDWVVISIPEAQDYVLNNSSYSPIANTAPQAYTQPGLLSALLRRTMNANSGVLSQLKLSQEHPQFPIPLQKNLSLLRLCELGAQDVALAFHAWRAFWREITSAQPATGSQQRPPILITVDSLNHWMLDSKYHDPDYKAIHAHQFQTISLFISLLFNCPPVSAWDPATRTQNPKALEPPTLPNGGLVLSSLTASNSPNNPSLATLLSQIDAYNRGIAIPPAEPYTKYDPRVLNLSWYATGETTQAVPTFFVNTLDATPSLAMRQLVWHASPDSVPRSARKETDFWEATRDTPDCPDYVKQSMTRIKGRDLARPEIVKLNGLSKDETRALLEYAAESGILRERVDERFVGEKWTMAGGGIVGEVLNGGLRVRV